MQFTNPAVPDCTGHWLTKGIEGGSSITVAGQNKCPTCSCEPSATMYCGLYLGLYKTTTCTGDEFPIKMIADGKCKNYGLAAFERITFKRIEDMHIIEGSCTPMVSGSPTFPPAQWDSPSRTCMRV
ncbi:MAG TPA: hypothetical protein PLJ27_15585 [Polyangiaceae bacterium]|nr:MAG: hypothetical protein BWY17_04357 [Deltaproteobacteria bacterium ADurb.Bin207]HNT00012.1 hypothetical protein [Polyangiaceae bacterium]HNZ24275.1 hypothetical protein [Polyangiaceae bacterium]HOD24804.1 hypothetical protein [Polyangiaceae bacterium]HOE49696.1 hypothetical protein [Polyangiaceae bacterium]